MRCRICKQPIVRADTGRRPRYCSTRCRSAAYRRRCKQSVHFSSRTSEWATPPELFAKLHTRHDFTLDVCATPANAKCERYFTSAEDGLAHVWTGRVWMNPPYGREIGAWMRKAWEASQSTAEVVVCLVPARTDTAWWHEYAMRGEVEFLPSRVRFGGAAHSAPFPSAIVVFRDAASVTKEAGLVSPRREVALV
jgi:phage N-6-adenine-methyltransferase